MEEEITWKDFNVFLKHQPTHENGLGYYCKIPNSAQDSRGFFTFLRAVYNKRFYQEEVDLLNDDHAIPVRCDSGAPKGMPMPTALHEEDEETGLCLTCGSSDPIYPTTNSHNASLSNSIILRMPMHGYKGFVGYLELRDREAEEREVYENCNMARTLPELFRLMLEWEWVYLNLDQNDIHAKLAYEMLQEMELPEEIRQWLWDEVPEMQVARFLKGDPDARSRPDPSKIPLMSDDFDRWCWFRIAVAPQLWKYCLR